MNEMKLKNFIGVDKNSDNILGKFLYFNFADVLIEKEILEEICNNFNLPFSVSNRTGHIDAFKSATGDIYDRIVKKESSGELKIVKAYFKDNKKGDKTFSRELIKETLDDTTNRYKKLGNIFIDMETSALDYAIDSFDSSVDVNHYINKATDLYELYKMCARRGQVEGVLEKFLSHMEAMKINVYGRLYFVPKKTMHLVDSFEDFLEELNSANKREHSGKLTVNSIYVTDDSKQRAKLAEEFYQCTKKEIEFYISKMEHFIETNSSNAKLMERWILRAGKLEENKAYYENLLKQSLEDTDEEFTTLKLMTSEFSYRVKSLYSKAA